MDEASGRSLESSSYLLRLVSSTDTALPSDEVYEPTSPVQSIGASPEDLTPLEKNDLSPVARLDEDVLIPIFQYAIDDCNPKNKRICIRDISEVCQRWRRVAIYFPAFWTSIDCTSTSWANEMLKRAQSLPISIKFDMCKMHRTPYLTTFDNHVFDLSRIESLDISSCRWDPGMNGCCTSEDVDQLLDAFHGTSALRFFHYRIIGRNQYSVEEPADIPLCLFPLAPHLQHLRLECCHVEWDHLDPGCFAELISLNLDGTTSPCTMQQLYGILSVTKRLQSLSLSYRSDDPLPRNDVPPGTLIFLPNLSFLHIKANLHMCAHTFLDHFSYPANAKIEFWTEEQRDGSPVLTLPSSMSSKP